MLSEMQIEATYEIPTVFHRVQFTPPGATTISTQYIFCAHIPTQLLHNITIKIYLQNQSEELHI